MNFHWHALAEQLQQHPDLLEEELQGEVAAMSAQAEAQSSAEKELDVLRRLQAQLGNHGLQKLLSGAPGPARKSPEQQSKETPIESGVAQPELLAQAAPELETEAREEPMVEEPAVTEEPVAEAAPVADMQELLPDGVVAEVVEPAAELAPEPVVVDTRRQLEGLLRHVLTRLPHLDVPTLTELAALFDQQSPSLRAKIVATLVARSQGLPEAEQQQFLAAIRKLSGVVARSKLIAALLARLLAVAPPPPVPVVEPEPPEEDP